MEGKKFFAELIPVSSARNEEEKMQIRIFNAAAIGAVKQFNKMPTMGISEDDLYDTYMDAYVNTVTHVSSDSGALAYANCCGMTGAIKTRKDLFQKTNTISRVDRLNEDGEWEYSILSQVLASENRADAKILLKETDAERERKNSIIRECYLALSEEDRFIADHKVKKTPYKQIAAEMEKSEGAIQKRSHDLSVRFKRLLNENGYFQAV